MYGYTVFHPKIAQNLIKNVRGSRVSNTYIFEGVKGMYKTETARLFANALVCRNISAAPCGECHPCIEARAMTNPDIKLVTHDTGADGKPKKTIGIDTAREICADAALKPAGIRKVYIIPDGENMTVEAQNALLKTLEEPPAYAVFIIIVPSASVLLPTIISRSEVISFNQVSAEIIRKYIEEKYPDKRESAGFITKYCAGVPGIADKTAVDEDFENMRSGSLMMLTALVSQDPSDAFKVQKYIEENKDSAGDIVDMWIMFLRDISVIQCGEPEAVINSDRLETLRGISSKIEPARCMNAVKRLVECKEMMSKSVKLSAAVLRCALLI